LYEADNPTLYHLLVRSGHVRHRTGTVRFQTWG